MNVNDPWNAFGSQQQAIAHNDWFTCLDSQGTSDETCTDTSATGVNSYKGLWRPELDSINWDTQVWSHLEVLAPPPQ